jgi:N4-gp56 family major capsid protein
MAIQTFSTFQANSHQYIAAQTLKRIHRDLVVYGMGKKEKLPNRFSKTFQYTRYEKLDLPYSPITEGVTPSSSDMSINTVQAVMDQWGSFVNLSDVAQITAKHPALQQAIQLLGEQASEVIDRECIKLLLSNTNVTYPGAATSRVTIGAGDIPDTAVVKQVLADLRKQGARGISGRIYQGLLDPFHEMDVMDDTTFVNAASYSNIVALKNGEVGTWFGVRWMCSNLIPSMSRIPDASAPAASSGTAGSLANSTTYYYKVVGIDNALGFEVSVSQELSIATGAGDTSVDITMPADAGIKYNVYFGDTSGQTYLSSTLNDPSAVVNVGAVPASSSLPPAEPAVGIEVHYMWVLGDEAFAVPELMSLQTFLTPAQASDSDPLFQRRKASWKVMFKPVICNELFLERIEGASAY